VEPRRRARAYLLGQLQVAETFSQPARVPGLPRVDIGMVHDGEPMAGGKPSRARRPVPEK